MNYSIRTLMAITLAASFLLAAFRFLPAPVTSLSLLCPIVLLLWWIAKLCCQRNWNRLCLAAFVLPVILCAFYLGMLGPLAAWCDIAEMNGDSQLTLARGKILNFLYTPQSVCAPFILFDENLDSSLTHEFIVFMQDYQTAWEEAVERI